MREVARPFKDLEPAARDRLVRRVAVRDGDERILVAPDDKGRNLGGEIQAVGRARALAADVDDRTKRAHECGSGFGVPEREVATQYLARGRSRPQTEPPEPSGQRLSGASDARRATERQHVLGARRAQPPKERAHLRAETAGG